MGAQDKDLISLVGKNTVTVSFYICPFGFPLPMFLRRKTLEQQGAHDPKESATAKSYPETLSSILWNSKS